MSLPRPARFALKGTLLICVPVPACPAALDTAFTLGGEGRVTAASNPLLLSGGRREALLAEATLRPQLTVSGDTGDSIALDGVFTGRAYSRRYGRFLLGSARALGTIRDSERLTVTAATSYRREIAVDTLATSVDALVDPMSVRNSWRGEAALAWRPDARTEILPSITVERSTYSRSALQDTKSGSIVLAAGRRLDEASRLGVRAVATSSRVADRPDLNLLAIFATLERRLGTAWRLEASAGVERIGATRGGNAAIYPNRGAQAAFSGDIRLCHASGPLDACATAAQGSEVSAIDGFQRRTAAGLSATLRLDTRSSITTQLDYERIAGSSRSTSGRSLDGQQAVIRYDRRLSERTTLSGEVEFIRRQLGAGSAPRSAFVGVRLSWEPRRR